MRNRTKAGLVATALLTAVATTATAGHAQPAAHPGADPGLRQQVLATGDATNPYVRTPALAVTNRGTLISAYDPRPAGDGDVPNHLSLVVQRSTDGGTTWGARQTVRSEPAPNGFSDPSLLVDHKTGRIFLFYCASVNQGFFGSGTGNDDNDPNILQTDVSYSDDDGLTWTNRVLTHEIKDPSWNGIFAASGEGTQLTTGPHAGRLVQQYVVGDNGGEYAVSSYSDDDGATWRMGDLVGPGMNENKTVQLADGDVLLDVRDAPNRLLATSTDGGVTYGPPVANPDLPDPSDNGSIIRFAPGAPAADPRSHWLLESNNDSTTARANLVVKLSYDDGRTWPVTKVVDAGDSAYSTLTRLPNGHFALLYEANGYTQLTYATFTPEWLTH